MIHSHFNKLAAILSATLVAAVAPAPCPPIYTPCVESSHGPWEDECCKPNQAQTMCITYDKRPVNCQGGGTTWETTTTGWQSDMTNCYGTDKDCGP